MAPLARLGVVFGTAVLLAAGAGARADELSTGVALFQQGKFAEAESHLRNASGTDASAYLAAALARQKKFGEAEAAAKAALQDNAAAHEMAVAALGESLVGQKKHDEAVERMSTAVKARADLAYAYYWRGQAYYNKKQPDRMVGDFETFLKLAPKAPEAATVQQLLAGLR